MKKIVICLLCVIIASQYGCKKFLDVTPIDKVTGNNYYKSAQDVELTITDMYGRIYQKYIQTNTAGATGEFRSGETIPSSNGVNTRVVRGDIALVGGHKFRIANSGITTGLQPIAAPYGSVRSDRYLLEALQSRDNNGNTNPTNFYALTRWNEYYQVIQSANILIEKLEEGIPSMSGDVTNRYIAECKFIRCYCYFTMVRLYGDVVYYTKAFQKDPLPRTNMVTVVKNCIAELTPVRNDLPMAITDPSNRGVRASGGAVRGLLMNMNMWNAGFDPANKNAYYTETESLGKELMGSNAFRLVALSEWSIVTKGRSEESLFELFSSANYSNSVSIFALAPFGEAYIHFPYKLPEYDNRSSPAVFTAEYMKKLYPNFNDNRLNIWFEDPYNQNCETFQLKKYATNSPIDNSAGARNGMPDNTFMIMRYADAILLAAEAACELRGNDDPEAIRLLNLIRERAGAEKYPATVETASTLRDVIFWERAKELMGEGSHYFDLVRTKRILNRNFTDNPLTSDKFNRGGWTWPIDASALTNNPYMSLNTYWIGSGIE